MNKRHISRTFASLLLAVGMPGSLLLFAEDAPLKRVIVPKVLSADLALQKINPPNLLINAMAEVPTAGYTDAQLHLAQYQNPPKDGIQDCYLTAVSPTGAAAQVMTQIQASAVIVDVDSKAPWLRGVRIHGTGKGVVIKMRF
jgi:hypothetical protein